MVEDVEVSILAGIGRSFGWIFRPLGFGEWKSAVAAVTGLIAKENVVATFGILFGFGEVSEAGEEIWPQLQAYYTPAAAYSYLVFNLLCAPCVAAIGAMKREMNNARWTWFAIGYQTIFAYVVSFCVYEVGRIISGEAFSLMTLLAFVFIAALLYLLFMPAKTASVKSDAGAKARA